MEAGQQRSSSRTANLGTGAQDSVHRGADQNKYLGKILLTTPSLQVWILLKSERELEGTLLGFDAFLNLVLGDVVDYATDGEGRTVVTRMGDVLLNGANSTCQVRVEACMLPVAFVTSSLMCRQ